MVAKIEISPDVKDTPTPEKTVKVEADDEPPKATWRDFFTYFGKWDNARVLIGCASSWFLLDIAFYGLGLNQSIVLTAIGEFSPIIRWLTRYQVTFIRMLLLS